jgi:hypothetical protein
MVFIPAAKSLTVGVVRVSTKDNPCCDYEKYVSVWVIEREGVLETLEQVIEAQGSRVLLKMKELNPTPEQIAEQRKKYKV